MFYRTRSPGNPKSKNPSFGCEKRGKGNRGFVLFLFNMSSGCRELARTEHETVSESTFLTLRMAFAAPVHGFPLKPTSFPQPSLSILIHHVIQHFAKAPKIDRNIHFWFHFVPLQRKISQYWKREEEKAGNKKQIMLSGILEIVFVSNSCSRQLLSWLERHFLPYARVELFLPDLRHWSGYACSSWYAFRVSLGNGQRPWTGPDLTRRIRSLIGMSQDGTGSHAHRPCLPKGYMPFKALLFQLIRRT